MSPPLVNGHLAGNSRALRVKAFYWMHSTRGSRSTSLFLIIRKSYRKTELSPVLPLVAGRGTAPMKERRKGGGGEHDRAVCRSPPFRNQSVYRLAASSCAGFPPPPGLPMKGLGYTAGPSEDSESGFTPTPPSPICTDSPLVGTVLTLERSEEPLDKQRASTKQTRENNRNHSPS